MTSIYFYGLLNIYERGISCCGLCCNLDTSVVIDNLIVSKSRGLFYTKAYVLIWSICKYICLYVLQMFPFLLLYDCWIVASFFSDNLQ